MNPEKTPTTEVMDASVPTQAPAYRVTETAEEFVITAQLPGVSLNAVETLIDGDDLVIQGRRTWQQPEGWKLLHEEIPAVDYRLELRLDHRVNREALKAHFTNGILTVILPKAETVRPRRIQISD